MECPQSIKTTWQFQQAFMKAVFHMSFLLCSGVWGYVCVWVTLSVQVCRREKKRERERERERGGGGGGGERLYTILCSYMSRFVHTENFTSPVAPLFVFSCVYICCTS